MKKILAVCIIGIVSLVFIQTQAISLQGDGATIRSMLSERISYLAEHDLDHLNELSRRIPLLLKAFEDNPADKALLFFIQKEIQSILTPIPQGEVHPGIIAARAEQFQD